MMEGNFLAILVFMENMEAIKFLFRFSWSLNMIFISWLFNIKWLFNDVFDLLNCFYTHTHTHTYK